MTTSRISNAPSLLRSFHQAQRWAAEHEPVTREPTGAEAEGIKEESFVTPDVADGVASSEAPQMQEQPASALDAVSDASGSTSESLGQSEAPAATATTSDAYYDAVESSSSTDHSSTITEKAADLASTAAATASIIASTATRTARDALDSVRPERRDRTDNRPERRSRDSFDTRAPRPAAAPSKILYVGNLFFEVTAPQLTNEFSQFGSIANSRVVTDSRGMSKGFAYIEFSSQQEADAAVAALNQKVFFGRRMSVQYHQPRDGSRASGREFQTMGGRSDSSGQPREIKEPTKTLFIGNMSYQMSDKDLNGMLSANDTSINVSTVLTM